MAISPFSINQFGGLDVVTDPTDLGVAGAVDMLNVDFDKRGAIRCRDGLTTFTSFDQGTPAASNWQRMWEAHDGRIIAGAGSNMYAINGSTGAQVATSAAFIPGGQYVNYGQPTVGFTLIQRSAAGPGKWDGAAFSTPAYTGTTPSGGGLAITPWDNRLVNWEISGNPFRVIFSDAGDPFTFQANNFIDLVTDDSTGLSGRYGCVWGGQLFLLTKQYLHVFYGTSTLSDGSPVFQKNTFPTSFADALRGHMVAGPDGVYLITTKGLYRSQGGPFTLISDAVSPIVQGDSGVVPTALFLADPTSQYAVAVEDKLYFPCSSVSSSGNRDYILVWNIRTQAWLLWSTAFHWLGWQSRQRQPRVFVSLRTGTTPNPITYFDPAATTDNGTAISWSYTSGLYDLGDRARKVIAHTDVVGSGTVTLRINAQDAAPNRVADVGSSVTLGVAPALVTTRRRRAVSGRFFQHVLSGSGQAVVSSLTHGVQSGRQM